MPLVNRSFWTLIVLAIVKSFHLATNTFWFPASELSTHNYTDGSKTAFSLSNILNLRSITEIIDLQQILERPRVHLPPMAIEQPCDPALVNSNLSTPTAPPMTRSIPETISLGQGTQNPQALLPDLATGRPDDPTMSNSQPQIPPLSSVPRSTPEKPYPRATFDRRQYNPPTFDGMPREIQDQIWEFTIEPRIVHIKYSLRKLPDANDRLRSAQEAKVANHARRQGSDIWVPEPEPNCIEAYRRNARLMWGAFPWNYAFKSSCRAPAMLGVCGTSRAVATQRFRYEKLFGSVWFRYDLDTLFLDFGYGLPVRNAYSETDLPMDDLERVRFVAFYSSNHFANPQRAQLLSRMMARVINLEKVFLCSFGDKNCIQATDRSDLVFMAQCPTFLCCTKLYGIRCLYDNLHILNCSCVDPNTVARQDWYVKHSSFPGIILPQRAPQIFWRHVLPRVSRQLVIENAERMHVRVLP